MKTLIRLINTWWYERRLSGFLAIARIHHTSNVYWASITIPKTLAREIWANKQRIVQTHSTLLDDELCIIVPLTPPRNADGVPYHELAERRRDNHDPKP